MQKKIVVQANCLMVLFSIMLLFTMNKIVEATEDETNVGITFEHSSEITKPEVKPPLIDGGNNRPSQNMLPRTGELLTSLIVLLIGASIFVFSLGILVIRQLYQKPSWEG